MYEDNAAYFGSDLDLMKGCQSIKMAAMYVERLYVENPSCLVNGEGKQLSKDEATKYIRDKAYFAMKYMRERKDLIHKSLTKIDVGANLIDKFIAKFGNKAITFGQVTESADILTEKLSNKQHINIVSYHSNIPSIEVSEHILYEHNVLEEREGKTINMFKNKPIKCSKDRLFPLYISMFDKGELNVLSSARALEVGFDAKGVLLGVMISGDSDPEGAEQIRGRSCRKEKIIYKDQEIEKVACFVNIVLRGTKDETWLNYRQKGKRARTVNSIEEILIDFENVLDNQLK